MTPTAAGAVAGPETPGFRRVPRTGVIYVMHRAAAAGHGSDGRTLFAAFGGGVDGLRSLLQLRMAPP